MVVYVGSPPSLSWGFRWTWRRPGRRAALRRGQWYHVAATYSNGTSQIYVNGKLDGSNYHKSAMSLMKDIYFHIGGLRGHYDFAGDIDEECGVSNVARSADWFKLEYENQKAHTNPGRFARATGRCVFGFRRARSTSFRRKRP